MPPMRNQLHLMETRVPPGGTSETLLKQRWFSHRSRCCVSATDPPCLCRGTYLQVFFKPTGAEGEKSLVVRPSPARPHSAFSERRA